MTVGLFSGRGVGFGFGAGCGFGIGFGFGGAPLHTLGIGMGGGCGVGLGVGWGFGLAYGARYIDSRPRFMGLDFGHHNVLAEEKMAEGGKELSKS